MEEKWGKGGQIGANVEQIRIMGGVNMVHCAALLLVPPPPPCPMSAVSNECFRSAHTFWGPN